MKPLGIFISNEGIKINKSKYNNMLEWQRPNTAKKMQKVLGLFNFDRKFIEKITKILDPYYNKIDKKKWEWNEELKN